MLFLLVTSGLVGLLYPYVFHYENSVNQNNNEFGEALFHITKFRSLIMMPYMGIITWLFFRKHYNIAETLSFWMFALGLTYVFRLVFIPVYFPFIGHKYQLDICVNFAVTGILLWQLLAVFSRKRSWSVVLCIVILLIYNTSDSLLQGYLIYDEKLWRMFDFSTVKSTLITLFLGV